MLGLIRLLEFVLSEAEVLLRVLVVGLFVVVVREGLLDGVLILIELPIRDDMLESILPLEFVLSEAEELLRVLKLLRLDGAGVGELGRVVICRPNVLELGAVGRELIDRLDVLLLEMLLLVIALLELLLLGVRLVMARLDLLLLGARLVMDLLELLRLGALLVMVLLELLLLGVRLDMDLLDELLLGVRLVTDLLELRLDETLLELLDDDGLDVALGAGAGFEACRV